MDVPRKRYYLRAPCVIVETESRTWVGALTKKGYAAFRAMQERATKCYRIIEMAPDRMIVDYSIDNDEKLKSVYSLRNRLKLNMILILFMAALCIYIVIALQFDKDRAAHEFLLTPSLFISFSIGCICFNVELLKQACGHIKYHRITIEKATGEVTFDYTFNRGKKEHLVFPFDRVIKVLVNTIPDANIDRKSVV
jgi:hypothetical protein